MAYRIYCEGIGGASSNCVVDSKSDVVKHLIDHNFINEEKVEITYLPNTMVGKKAD